MVRWLACCLINAAILCSPAAALCQARPARVKYWESDSIVLERQRGGWDSKSYRIAITKGGRVFVSPDSVAQQLLPVKEIQRSQFGNIMGLLLMASFERLPDSVATDPVFGQACASDNPTIIVTIYHPQLTKRVVDDQGCLYAPTFLRELERMILEAAGLRRPSDA